MNMTDSAVSDILNQVKEEILTAALRKEVL